MTVPGTCHGRSGDTGSFSLAATALPGCVEIRPRMIEDVRGRFVKVFHRDTFKNAGLATDFAEEYYTVSRRGVLRGLHFQAPPMDHAKLVYCVEGRVQDAVLDLRNGSPSQGRHIQVELSAKAGNMLHIPCGMAHGFCVLSDTATLVYKVTSAYSAEHDVGILWNSAGIPWAVSDPILSERDRTHPRLADFISPFTYEVHS